MYQKIIQNLQSDYDGTPISALLLLPEKKVRGILQIVHGMSEYKERYLPFMEYMAKRGFLCVIHDHRGHGMSVRCGEDLGYFYEGGGRAVIEDIHQITLYMKEQWGEQLPLILFGHSMGSLAVRAYMKQYDDLVSMLIVCGSPSKNPLLGLGKSIASVEGKLLGKRHKSTLLESMSFGPYMLRFAKEKSKFAWVCSDPEVVAEYDKSPYCGFTFTDDGYQALFQLMQGAYSKKGWQMKNPQVPVLFISGQEDPCMGSIRQFSKAVWHMRYLGYKDVRGKVYPGMRHEILNEKEKNEVYRDIATYIYQKLYREEK